MGTLDTRIDRWVEAGVITPATGDDLRRFEAEHPAAPAPVVPATAAPAPSPAPEQPRALALVGEVIGYLGAVLAVSAIAFVVSQTWNDMPSGGRIALVAALTAIVAAAGVLAARAAQAPAQRLASVLLVASVALVGWLTWVVLDELTSVGDNATGQFVTGAMVITSAGIYAVRRRALAQMTLLASLAALTVTLMRPWDMETANAVGFVVAGLGAVWVTLAILRLLQPRQPALVTGGLLVFAALQATAFAEGRGLLLTGAVAVGVAMVPPGVARRDLIPLIVPGAIMMLAFVPQLIDHLVGDTIATMVAVGVTGIALVLLAVWMVRRQRPQTAPPASPPT